MYGLVDSIIGGLATLFFICVGVLLVPWIVCLFIAGIICLWQHAFYPLLPASIIAFVLDVVIVVVAFIYLRSNRGY